MLKVAGNYPMTIANEPRKTAKIAPSTKRSFPLYFINKSYKFFFYWIFINLKKSFTDEENLA